MGKTIKRGGGANDAYLELIRRFPLTSIRDDKMLAEAQQVLDSLLAMRLNVGEQTYVDALSDLIEIYETQNVQISEPTDAAVLEYLMKLKDISQTALSAETQIQKSTISEVLSGKRCLTRAHIARLAKFFGVGQSAFSIANE